MSVYNSEDWLKIRPYFVKKIKDFNVDLKDFIDEYLSWMSNPDLHIKGSKGLQGRFDAYAIIYRDVLCIDKNGKDADPSTWGPLFDRIKDLHDMIMKDGSLFAKVQTCENLAHRYLDLYLLHGKKEDYNMFKGLYKSAHKYALEGKYWKNVDSSYYWLGIAYIRCDEYEKAVSCFCRVHRRRGKRYNVSSAFNRKLKFATNCCKRKKVLPCNESFQFSAPRGNKGKKKT
tara:strand:- start:25388 stop:26074 length:687 start_codon:yes stop_codon:yes gene_type:complete